MDHKFKMCYLVELAIKKAETRYILISGADIILDYLLINSKILLMKKYEAISIAVRRGQKLK